MRKQHMPKTNANPEPNAFGLGYFQLGRSFSVILTSAEIHGPTLCRPLRPRDGQRGEADNGHEATTGDWESYILQSAIGRPKIFDSASNFNAPFFT
jgi:hypothetical protein